MNKNTQTTPAYYTEEEARMYHISEVRQDVRCLMLNLATKVGLITFAGAFVLTLATVAMVMKIDDRDLLAVFWGMTFLLVTLSTACTLEIVTSRGTREIDLAISDLYYK